MLKHFQWDFFFSPSTFKCVRAGVRVCMRVCVCAALVLLLKLWSYQARLRLLPRCGQISCCVDAAKERFRLRRFLSSSESSAETQLLHSGHTLYWLWQGHCTCISPRTHKKESWVCVCVLRLRKRERKGERDCVRYILRKPIMCLKLHWIPATFCSLASQSDPFIAMRAIRA